MAIALSAHHRSYDLPWTSTPEERARLQRSLQISIGAVLVACLLIPYLPVPERQADFVAPVPARLARLVIEQRTPPPPPPAPAVREPPQKASPVVAPVPRPEATVRSPDPVDRVDQARRKASVAGLLPLEDQLAALRDNSVVEKATQTRNLTGAVGETTRAERSLITSGVGKGSGGINTAALSRGYGGGTGALAGHETTQVGAPAGSGGEGAEVRRSSASTKAARSREEIELVFDRNKSAIYALYSRALRDNPALQGKLVLEITISPSGEVTGCEVVSSDLKDPDLERRLVARIKLFRFEAKDVEAITTTKPIDFFPA